MIRVRIKVGNPGEEGDWEEDLEVSSMEAARDEAVAIIDKFNVVEESRYGTTARKREYRGFVALVGEMHEWHKVNLVTEPDMKDTWKCDKCGIKARTFLGGPPSGMCRGKVDG